MKLIRAELNSDIEYTLNFEAKELKTIIDCLEAVLEKYDELDEVLLDEEYSSVAHVLDKLEGHFDEDKINFIFSITSDEFDTMASAMGYLRHVEFEIFNLKYTKKEVSDIAIVIADLVIELINTALVEKE